MTLPAPNFQVLLIGNYRLDQQMSMLRYYDMLLREFRGNGISVQGIEPEKTIGHFSAGKLTKWLRYVDKYLFFPFRLRREVKKLDKTARASGKKLILHATDHSNAPYLNAFYNRPGIITVATCHDLLAVRGALGEDTDCPASGFGKILQQKILAGLRKTNHVICVSAATESDLKRLAPETSASVIPLALNQSFQVLLPEIVATKLPCAPPFILHVGSSLKRKNRDGILRIFAKISSRFAGNLVFAGEKLSSEQIKWIDEHHLGSRVVQVVSPPGEVIEALYNAAYAFLFPSKSEGFGWPIIEAQACGCPVLVARTTSLPEVVGRGGLVRDLEDEDGFGDDLLALQDSDFRTKVIEDGFQNLRRFQTGQVIGHYRAIYETLAGTEAASDSVSINRA